MNKQVKVAVTGFYGTGSSAVIDLLKEYDGVHIAAPTDGEYEHIAFYAPGGLFDLASIIKSPSCSVYNSDMAINNFINTSKRLNQNFGWFGSYSEYGTEFLHISEDFVHKIAHETGRQSAAHIIKIRYSLFKVLLQLAAKIIIKRPINKLGRVYVYDKNPGYYSMPTADEFDNAAREYVEKYLEMCSGDNFIEIFDHLLWPQQVNSLGDYFPKDFKVIVVDRDPRDVYLLNKYYWFTPEVSLSKPYYQTDAIKFCKEWIESRRLYNSSNVLYLQFEDLIYKYDESLDIIEQFLEMDHRTHIKTQKLFIPSRSIENTQIFNNNENWKKEISVINNTLNEYIYNYPYERTPDKSLWFDTEAQLAKVRKIEDDRNKSQGKTK